MSTEPIDPRPSRRARYSALFDRIREGVFLLSSEDFRILEVNDAGAEMLGYPPNELVGILALDLVTQEKRSEFYKSLRVARRRYLSFRFDLILPTKDRTKNIELEVMACGLDLADGSVVLQLIMRDITVINELHRKLEALSTTDEMTGLPNFRSFKQELSKEHERVRRYGGTYALLFCDVDHFKAYNDRNGHPAGDEVLRGVARILQKSVRKTDMAARYGGEEFVVLCPGIDGEGGREVAERIRSAIESYPFEHGSAQPLGKVTISVGVCGVTLPPGNVAPAEAFETALKHADAAVYASKKAGRNRVTVASSI